MEKVVYNGPVRLTEGEREKGLEGRNDIYGAADVSTSRTLVCLLTRLGNVNF